MQTLPLRIKSLAGAGFHSRSIVSPFTHGQNSCWASSWRLRAGRLAQPPWQAPSEAGGGSRRAARKASSFKTPSPKGAIEALTRTLALELAEEGIVVNVMHPPLTRTPSAAGFGVPPEMMADPEKVGRGLARQVGMDRPYLTPDISTALSLWANRHFPVVMGRLLNSMAKRARRQAQ